MAKINLKQYGITGTTEVIYNPSYTNSTARRPARACAVMKRVR